MKSTKKIARLADNLRKAKHELRTALIDRVCRCKHPPDQIVECFSSSPSMRLCKLCGISEVGWGIGYVLLNRDVYSGFPKISADELYRQRSFATISHDHKCKLAGCGEPKVPLRILLQTLSCLT